ncbi:MAG: hypothetical protein QM758_17585 [Armatimonas sp.]
MNGRTQPLVIGLVGVIFVLLAVIGFVASRSMNPPTPTPAPTVLATATPEPTPEPEEATPSPTPTPAPSTEAGAITFGHSVERMKLSGETDSFAPDDAFAFVATSPQPFAATTLEATLARQNGSDTERFLRRWTVDIPGPESKQLSQSFSRVDSFLETSEPGTYIFRLIHDGKTLSKGTFTLTALEDSTPEETIEPEEKPADLTGWRSYRSDTLGVDFAAPDGWSVASGRDGEEIYLSIRKSETPPISLRLLQNPASTFDVQERDKRQAFGKKYHRIGRNTDREFHGIPAETWSFTEPSDSGALKRILKFQFDQGGHRWEFVIVAPEAEYDSYREDFNRIIDRIAFN